MFGVQEIDSQTLAKLLQTSPESIQLVDVREVHEIAQGMIEGADRVPLHLVPLHASDWAQDRRPMVIYCRSGARSAQACAFLAARDAQRQYINLRGGILDWARSGLPISLPPTESAYA